MKRTALGLLFLVIVAPGAHAQDPEDVATRVSQEIMSPFCDGVTLHDCPSRAADQLRRRIVTMARSGMSQEQIIATLEVEYGDRIGAAPDNPLSWIVPAAALLAGIGLIATLARRWTGTPPRGPATPISQSDRTRVESELAAHRGQP